MVNSRTLKQKWRLVSINNKLVVLFAGVTAIATVIYCFVAWWTLREIRGGSVDTHNLAVAASNQAEWAKRLATNMQTQADRTKELSEGTKVLAERMKDQADRTKTIADQAIIQAQAAQVTADAARRSADAATSAAATDKSALETQTSPWLGITAEEASYAVSVNPGGVSMGIRIKLHNYGNSPAIDVRIVTAPEAIAPIPPQIKLSEKAFQLCSRSTELTKEAPDSPADQLVVWPTDTRELQSNSFNNMPGRYTTTYLPGCISYRDITGRIHHTFFDYAIDTERYHPDQVKKIHLMGVEPLPD